MQNSKVKDFIEKLREKNGGGKRVVELIDKYIHEMQMAIKILHNEKKRLK